MTEPDPTSRVSLPNRVNITPSANDVTTTSALVNVHGASVPRSISLCALRESKGLTQAAMAQLLGIKQANVSRLEARGDMLVSSLRNYLLALDIDLEFYAKIGQDDFALRFDEARNTKHVKLQRKANMIQHDDASYLKSQQKL